MYALKLTRQELIVLQDLVSKERTRLNYSESNDEEATFFELELVTKMNDTFKKQLTKNI